jgi:hypothetical protein
MPTALDNGQRSSKKLLADLCGSLSLRSAARKFPERVVAFLEGG